MNWRTAKGLYTITEITRKGTITFPMMATGAEIAKLCRDKNEANGYIEGLCGDKKYSCFAILETYIKD